MGEPNVLGGTHGYRECLNFPVSITRDSLGEAFFCVDGPTKRTAV